MVNLEWCKKQKRGLKLIQRHIERVGKITKEDILRDVHTFKDSQETQSYLKFFLKKAYGKYLTDDAKELLSHIGSLAVDVEEKRIQKLEKRASGGI